MNLDEKKHLRLKLASIAEMTKDDVTPERIDLTASVLEDYKFEDVSNALKEGLRSWTWFPAPADIIKLFKSEHETAHHWIEIICDRAMRRGMGAGPGDLPDHVRKSMNCVGGFRAFCLTETSKLPFLKRDFAKAYDDFSEAARRSDVKALSCGESKDLLKKIEDRDSTIREGHQTIHNDNRKLPAMDHVNIPIRGLKKI